MAQSPVKRPSPCFVYTEHDPAIDDYIFIFLCLKIAIGDIDGDTLLSFGGQAVKEPRQIGLFKTVPFAEVFTTASY